MRKPWGVALAGAALAGMAVLRRRHKQRRLVADAAEDGGARAAATLEELEARVRAREAARALEPGTDARIRWFAGGCQRTRHVIVQLHGWSGSRQEHGDVVERLADQLCANVYSARLPGHGLAADAGGRALLDEATPGALLACALDALAIGRKLGERLVLVGTSTGGALAAWAASRPELEGELAAIVLVSPAFALAAPIYPAFRALKAAADAALPAALARALMTSVIHATQGRVKTAPGRGELHRRYWTLTYPTAAILNLVAVIEAAAASDLAAIRCPVLVIGSHGDRAISWDRTIDVYKRLGGKKVLVTAPASDEDDNHVLCNPILSPSSVGWLEAVILSFAKQHVKTVLDWA